MPDAHVVIVGAGLAGLVAAATVREHGVDVVVHEASAAPGGATVESAGWIWRHRDLATWRRAAPTASPVVTSLVLDRLDAELEWLVARGIDLVATSTGRGTTVGANVDPRGVIDRLVDIVGGDSIVTGSRVSGVAPDPIAPTVLAAGGYAGDFARIARECDAPAHVAEQWVRRPVSCSQGDGVDAGTRIGGSLRHQDGECLVRLTLPEPDRVRPLLSAASELLVPGATLLGRDGCPVGVPDAEDWSGARVLRRFQVEHGAGWIELPRALLEERVHSGRIGCIVDQLEAATPDVERRGNGSVRIAVRAGITHTWCGLEVDRASHVVGTHLPVFAAGCDAAGSGHGGSASGLAQALVLGRRAGAAAARAARTASATATESSSHPT